MDRGVYCLLVGIDAYGPPVDAPLRGCVNDIRHVERYLRGRLGDSAHVVTLTDHDAVRSAVIDGFRSHLSRAGPGDIALFSYSGHGSQEWPAPEFAHGDASGKMQNLLLADAGHEVDGEFVWPLADKELGMLLDEVAARGAKVVATLDCCHSGDGTRDAFVTTRQWDPEYARNADPAVVTRLRGPRPPSGFLQGTAEHAASRPTVGHVALSACQSSEKAKEITVGDEFRGAFTATMLEVLENLGSTADYRTVIAAVRSRLERMVERQRPTLYPTDPGGPGDDTFFGGAIEPAPPSFLMTRSTTGWTIDAGSVHGLRAPIDGQEFRLTCRRNDGEPGGDVSVVAVDPGRSTVEPVGWEPDDTVYRAVITSVPVPPAAVSFDPGLGDEAEAAYDQVRQVLATAPADSGNVAVRERTPGSAASPLELRVRFDRDATGGACLRVLRVDGSAAVPRSIAPVPMSEPSAAMTVVRQLVQVARWQQIRELGSHRSALDGVVQLRIHPAMPGERTLPSDRAPAPLECEYTVPYGPDGAPPWVFMHLANTSDRDLHVAMLDLTEELGCHVLFADAVIARGTQVNVNRHGGPMELSLSAGVDPVPGARTQHWLKIVVSETEINAGGLELAPLVVPAGTGATRTITAVDPAAGQPAGADWSAVTVGLVIEVPETARGPRREDTAP